MTFNSHCKAQVVTIVTHIKDLLTLYGHNKTLFFFWIVPTFISYSVQHRKYCLYKCECFDSIRVDLKHKILIH